MSATSPPPPASPRIVLAGTVARPLVVGLTVLGMAFGAQVRVPMEPTPMTLQTLALVIGAALLGPALGPLAVLVYLALAVAGLPVLAGWTAAPGLAIFELGTLGYLVGFFVGAWIVGRGALARDRSAGLDHAGGVLPGMARPMIGAHLLILLLGMAWLARDLGWSDAFNRGARPLVIGAVVKSLLGAWVVALIARCARSDAAP